MIFKILFFLGLFFDVKGAMAFFEEYVAPFVVLGLSDLVFVAQFADFDLAAEALKHDLGFLLVGPLTFFHKNLLLSLGAQFYTI